jgi:ferritin-like metal-binding protein YciE
MKGVLMDSLRDLLIDELSDLYSAERQLIAALPKMAKAANSENLRTAFTAHLEQTRGQVERLDRVFELIEEKPKRKKCKAMEGLVEEGKEVIENDGIPEVKDAALIGAAQRVEHYEMAGYGTARALAETLGLAKVVKLLQATLDEEGNANKKLNYLATTEINEGALSASA